MRVAVDDPFVYWSEDTGVIAKTPRGGGPARVVAADLGGGTRYLMVAGNSIDWTGGPDVKRLTPK